MSPWFALCSWKRNNVTHLWVGLSLGLKLLQSFWSYRYQIYLVLILFLFNSQISNNARGYKIKTSWFLCSVLSPNANTSPFPIVYPPITRKTIDNFFFSNLTALLQAMYFGKIQSSKFYFHGGLFFNPVLLLKLKPNRSLNIWNVCIHTMGSKAGTTLGEEVDLKIKKP